MGSSLSDRQEDVIVKTLGPQGRVVLMFDADESGRFCTDDCLRRFNGYVFVKGVDISGAGDKPHQIEQGTIQDLLGGL